LAAPFLFGGILVVEGIKFFIDHEKSEYVAPVAQSLGG